jgi:hypothetical protein
MSNLPALQTNNLNILVEKGFLSPREVELYTLEKTRPEKPTLKELGNTVQLLVRDCGAQSLEQYDVVRIATFIQQRYGEFSLKELKTAFEYAMTGEYGDEFDSRHFGHFSVMYVSRILNAYRSKRKESRQRVVLALPEPEIKKTPEEIQQIHDNFITTLEKIYSDFINGKNVEQRVTWIIYEFLDKRKLISLTRKQKQKLVEVARKKLREERQNLSIIIRVVPSESDPEANVKGVAKALAVIQQFEKFKSNGVTRISDLVRKKETTQV